ncbi:PREDICTED: root meristem growth factor 4-like [Camelina sativa]|uniref:Root meristem growth factor 4-like n=1 Tax=Camelina sativa TaxID=90675 RepID=A0ABM0TFT5_CAMSA|nr:PREDICTED: root meristem growth factor 4-like [Camelina sativa]
MMRFTTIVVAFLLIIQSLEEEHVLLVYAHEGGEAGHRSLDYREDQDSSTLHPQVLYNVAPRKLRSGRTVRAEKKQVTAMNNDNWSFKMSASSEHLTVGHKLGFHKRREHKQTNVLADIDTTKHTSCQKMMTIVNYPTIDNSLSRLEPSTSAKNMKKLARLLRNDYPIHSKPRRKPPINNQTPGLIKIIVDPLNKEI